MKEKTMASAIDTLLERIDAQDGEIQRLRELVEEDGKGHEGRVRSRRDVLRLAGAAVIGAAGAAALRVVPAAATNGDPITVGGTFTGTQTTTLNTTGGSFLCSTTSGAGATAVFGIAGTGIPNGSGVVGFGEGTDAVGMLGFGTGTSAVGGFFGGGRTPVHMEPGSAAGPPTVVAHSRGDLWVDANGIIWACITTGTPGVFAPLQTGAANITHFVKVSNLQYSLPNSNGKTWVDMDAANLVQTITPLFNAQAVISVSTALFTANAGFSQDIGIFISGGDYGTLGKIVAWNESGGFAGTLSPNAAFVETTQPLVAGIAYTIKVRWKTNKSAGGATIYAGAGPLPVGSAGGGVAGQISPTRLATHLVVDVPSPSVLTIPANNPSAKPPAPPALLRVNGRIPA